MNARKSQPPSPFLTAKGMGCVCERGCVSACVCVCVKDCFQNKKVSTAAKLLYRGGRKYIQILECSKVTTPTGKLFLGISRNIDGGWVMPRDGKREIITLKPFPHPGLSETYKQKLPPSIRGSTEQSSFVRFGT